jgi:hypothetical protein
MRKQDFEKFEEEARQTKARFDSLRFRTSALRTQGSSVVKPSAKPAKAAKRPAASKAKRASVRP